MNDIDNFLKQKHTIYEYLKLFKRIANQQITGNPNKDYVRKISVQRLDPNCPMYIDTGKKEIVLNVFVVNEFLRNFEYRLFFLLLFLHECKHFIQHKTYMEEKDPINKFYRYFYTCDATALETEDELLHNHYFSEYEAHQYALSQIEEIKQKKKLPRSVVDRVMKQYREIVTNNVAYNPHFMTFYPIDGKKEMISIAQLELYKALCVKKENPELAPPLFHQLTKENRYHTMVENIQFLHTEQQKENYDPRLENVILYIENFKRCSREDLLDDIITLFKNYIKPGESNLSFYLQLLNQKTNQLLYYQNNIEERKIIRDYLEQLKVYYYQNGEYDFYYHHIEPYYQFLNHVPVILKRK